MDERRCSLVLEFVTLMEDVSCKDTTRYGTGGHRFIVLSMDRRRRLPLPIPSSHPYPKLAPERYPATVKRRKTVCRGLLPAGGVIWLRRGDQCRPQLPKLTHLLLPRTKPTTVEINLYKSMPIIIALSAQTPLRLARQSQEVMATCKSRRSQNSKQENHQCSRSFSIGRAIYQSTM